MPKEWSPPFRWSPLAVLLAVAGPAAQEKGAAGTPPAEKPAAMLAAAEEVMKEVEEVRGWRFKGPVAKDVRTREELRAFLERKLLEEELGEGKLKAWQAWLRTMGLIPEELDLRKTILEVLLNQIGGFYDPQEKAFYMMAESARFPELVHHMLMAHELCHALDDQYCDLARLTHPPGRALTEDEEHAIGSMVEGSATALMFAWMRRAVRRGAAAERLMEFQESELERARPLLEAPRYLSLLVGRYMVGAGFVLKGRPLASVGPGPDSGAAILEASSSPPRSSEQVLHPEKYWDPDQRDEPVRLVEEEDLVGWIRAASGRELVHRDTLGEMVCAILAVERKLNPALMGNPGYWTNRYARGWGGDRLFLLGARREDGEVDLANPGVVWVTMWDTEADRREFEERVRRTRGGRPGFDAAGEGRVAVFTFGACGGVQPAEVAARLRFEKDGRAWKIRDPR